MSDADRIEHRRPAPSGAAESEHGALRLNKDTLGDLDAPSSGDARGGTNFRTIVLCQDGEYIGGQLVQQRPATADCATVFASRVTC